MELERELVAAKAMAFGEDRFGTVLAKGNLAVGLMGLGQEHGEEVAQPLAAGGASKSKFLKVDG